ncbi:MAG: LysM peptidoglycan-binding domain-containing protein [Phycisphaerae bacterium]|jgi:nucleoid-associated protein YgaU|nr:LysM peptidoglycan-binding domain-containing protein [Phycisphaerae bacterium]MBT5365648.1 LysM peptidoglycan-binding domain-containing protein [Phycisphaerae bacterium]MBT6270374.1 LysM peptidoglycan-binding domain-containing protein [Phycisphaerae bacterium]MBT6282294.1 LysM peptidoglycan-binding domain-containing protein [Phycisphaerae bacterium]
MTRENKLSIVIAFGLLIFVGMLVADHFSIASQREIAALGSNVSSPPLVSHPDLLIPPIPIIKEITEPNSKGDVRHLVQRGETLRSICKAFYGDSGLASAISNWNSLPSANSIEIGQEISLPNRSALIILQNTTNTKPKKSSEPSTLSTPSMGKYTVKSGDTLSEISQKVMGTVQKTQLLIDLNKGVMPNPNKIRPGMVLRYPLPTT